MTSDRMLADLESKSLEQVIKDVKRLVEDSRPRNLTKEEINNELRNIVLKVCNCVPF